MKQIKDKQRARLTHCNLETLVTLATTETQPDVDKMAVVKQRQKLDNAGNKLFSSSDFLFGFNMQIYKLLYVKL
jgi:hypothetical protein